MWEEGEVETGNVQSPDRRQVAHMSTVKTARWETRTTVPAEDPKGHKSRVIPELLHRKGAGQEGRPCLTRDPGAQLSYTKA